MLRKYEIKDLDSEAKQHTWGAMAKTARFPIDEMAVRRAISVLCLYPKKLQVGSAIVAQMDAVLV